MKNSDHGSGRAQLEWASGWNSRAAKTVHLRAGPARDYPVVAILPGGAALEVRGCLRGYTWCDVVAGPHRGWVYAANIRMQWQGREVPAPDIGTQLGIGIIGFILGEYWADHYRNQHFYRDRDRWRDPRLSEFRSQTERVSDEPF